MLKWASFQLTGLNVLNFKNKQSDITKSLINMIILFSICIWYIFQWLQHHHGAMGRSVESLIGKQDLPQKLTSGWMVLLLLPFLHEKHSRKGKKNSSRTAAFQNLKRRTQNPFMIASVSSKHHDRCSKKGKTEVHAGDFQIGCLPKFLSSFQTPWNLETTMACDVYFYHLYDGICCCIHIRI